ncbi:LysE family translocator [Phytomonospora endophytica]|uniref:Threonine/homoserine/homoserine lactone efflux protein n=1 Tax=Phytomonospora endophytica TaxID=714109 RepID=A0A841FU68_9ACTN|nr:LysE family translocator [Phytomonospora endophytica]MBB6039895.1 threonine/homoserine/homoserine lactone efflux protein [Phytomonospora endophytica]GIG71035.1 lysine transporter LysE [Phytomonospora endophytica]
MPSLSHLAGFAAMAFVLIAVPGPSVLFVIGRALAHGRRTALLTVAGNTVGAFVQVTAVAFGVGAIVAKSTVVFTVLKLAGAAYLVYLGVVAWRRRRDLHAVYEAAGEARSALRTARDGFVVGVTNPKAAVFFAAVLPQFVQREAGGVPVQMVVLGSLFCVLACVMDGAWGLAAAAARQWFGRSERRMAMIGGTGGLAMIGLGVTVAVTGRRD